MDGLMENPIKMDDSGVPLFLETSVLVEPLGGIGRCFFFMEMFLYFFAWNKIIPCEIILDLFWWWFWNGFGSHGIHDLLFLGALESHTSGGLVFKVESFYGFCFDSVFFTDSDSTMGFITILNHHHFDKISIFFQPP